MSLSHEDVTKIAKLARLDMGEDEVASYTDQLNGIFDWIEQLSEVDTDNVTPMAGVGDMTQRLREDIVTDGNVKEQVLKNAPGSSYGYFVVPKVVE